MVYTNLSELLNLEETLEEVIDRFYKDVFGMASGPRIEVDLYRPFISSRRNSIFSSLDWIVYVSPVDLIDLKIALDTMDLNKILDLLPPILYSSLYRFLNKNVQAGESTVNMGKKVLVSTLGFLYLFAGYLNADEIKEYMKRSPTLEGRLLMFGSYINEIFLDEKRLENIEKFFKWRCKYTRIPLFYASCSVIKEIGVHKFLEDVRRVLLDLDERDRILRKYGEFLRESKDNYASLTKYKFYY